MGPRSIKSLRPVRSGSVILSAMTDLAERQSRFFAALGMTGFDDSEATGMEDCNVDSSRIYQWMATAQVAIVVAAILVGMSGNIGASGKDVSATTAKRIIGATAT